MAFIATIKREKRPPGKPFAFSVVVNGEVVKTFEDGPFTPAHSSARNRAMDEARRINMNATQAEDGNQ